MVIGILFDWKLSAFEIQNANSQKNNYLNKRMFGELKYWRAGKRKRSGCGSFSYQTKKEAVEGGLEPPRRS
jgi:hypothetical protein